MTEQKQSKRVDPLGSRDSNFFWENAERGALTTQQCGDCEKYWHPPRPVCPACHSFDQRHVELSGRGTLHSWIVPRYPVAVGFDEAPIIALVDLEEKGIRLVTNIVDADLSELKPDLPVVVDFEKTSGGKSLPVFRLAGKAAQ
jgi:uncharacterized OB-fold protein